MNEAASLHKKNREKENMKNIWVAVSALVGCSLLLFACMLLYRANLGHSHNGKRSIVDFNEEEALDEVRVVITTLK